MIDQSQTIVIDQSRGDFVEQNKLCASDYKFMQLVWESEPICSGDLVKLSFDKLG